MKHPNALNIRFQVINDALEIEELLSAILMFGFRVFKESSKTLGNKSSSLSARTKIDLLHDFQEISDIEYNLLCKFFEIRNQFAHNNSSSTLMDVKEIYPDHFKYLKKVFDVKELSTEEDCIDIYFRMVTEVHSKLEKLLGEYAAGSFFEYSKYANDQVMKELDSILEKCRQYTKQRKGKIQVSNELEFFIDELKFRIEARKGDIIAEMNKNHPGAIYEKKGDYTEFRKEIDKVHAELKKQGIKGIEINGEIFYLGNTLDEPESKK